MRNPASFYDPDEMEPLVTAAIMYYQAHRSQEQIARHLGVSRPTVSRLLARARQLGIVRIEIVPPTADPGLAKDLEDRLRLRGVHLAAGLADPADPAPVLAGRLNEALAGIGLQAGDVVVVGWGRAIYSLGRSQLAPQPGVIVVPALGGSQEDRPWFQPNELARRWAATLEGTPRYLHAPAFVSAALKRSLVHEEGIQANLALWERATAALVGIGAYPEARPQPHRGRLLGGRRPGDRGGHRGRGRPLLHLRRDPAPLPGQERRLLGITPERLRRIPSSHRDLGRGRQGQGHRRGGPGQAGQHPGHRRGHGPRGGRPAGLAASRISRRLPRLTLSLAIPASRRRRTGRRRPGTCWP